MADTLLGTVRTWHVDRAFGWIATDQAVSCYFVHLDDVLGRVELRPDQHVRFMPVRTARGPRAVAVEILEEGSR